MDQHYDIYQDRRRQKYERALGWVSKGGIAVIALGGVLFAAEWTMPQGKRPLTAIANTAASMSIADNTAGSSHTLVEMRLLGMAERRGKHADKLYQIEAEKRRQKAGLDPWCGLFDIAAGGACKSILDQSYAPVFAELQQQQAQNEAEVTEIQKALSAPAARSGGHKGGTLDFQLSFEKGDDK